jgi:hypothetical protein
MPDVDLVVNTFERTYRNVLAPGFFAGIEEQNQRRFERKIALINNVNDPKEVEALAQQLVENGEIDAYYFVADRLDRALRQVGLTMKDLGRIPHYTDCALVAVTLKESGYLLYWDAEVRLQKPVNWVCPATELMERDTRILVANPNWWWRPTLQRETLWEGRGFAFGYGFSDQLFLARRDELSRPIYGHRCLASLRYPLAHIAPNFENRVDAYMRTHRRLRATYVAAVYEHPPNEGADYPAISWVEGARLVRNRAIVKLLRLLPTSNPCWRV